MLLKYINIIRNNYNLILLYFLITLPSIVLVSIELFTGNTFELLSAVFSFLVTIGLFLFVPLIFNVGLKKYFLILTPFYLLIPIIVFILLMYQQMPARWILYSMINTNNYETREFLQGLFIWKLAIFIYPLILVFFAYKIQLEKLNASYKTKLIFLFYLLLLPIAAYTIKSTQLRTLNVPFKKVLTTTFRDTPPYLFFQLYQEIQFSNNSKSIFPPKVKAVSLNSKTLKEIHVLIIGESSRYANWSINGYHRQTSLLLANETDIISFSNVISPSFLTSKSLRHILTNASITDDSINDTSSSIISVLNEVGFNTWWITNQKYSGPKLRNIVSQAKNIISIDCQPKICLDEKLFKPLDSALSISSKKKFIVIHLMGSHYPYQNRYSNDFNVFQPSLQKNNHIMRNEKHREELINSYDNSICYTDYIIFTIINKVRKNSEYASVIYISDHGESQFEPNASGFAKGFRSPISSVYHVPFFLWTSKDYQNMNKEFMYQSRLNKDLKYSLEDLYYTQMGVANINWQGYDSSRNITSAQFVERPRFVKLETEIVDFDQEFKSNDTE